MRYGTSKHYEGKKAKSYFAYQNQNAAIGALLNKEKFINYIKLTDKVLDFGCGGGWLLSSISCSKKVGVEVNLEAQEICKKNKIDVRSSIEAIKECDFDVIISNHCLEHVPYPIQALLELRDKLRHEGMLVVVVPIDDWRNQKDYTGEDIDHHLHTWTPRLLANTLVEAGYEIERIDILTHAWIPYFPFFLKIMPRFLFNFTCRVWSFLRRRRQIVAVARNGVK